MGCDLTTPTFFASYIRQSREEQAHNNRIPEYLLTAARLAKEHGVIVPREYVVIDHESSEYLDRKQMRTLREELIAKRRIAGVIVTHQGRLSADPMHQLIFERECRHYRIKLVFGDAPSGDDWASTAGRQLMAQANLLRLTTTREGARAGNIGRVLKGMVPAHRAAYGYRYCRDAEIGQDGRLHVKGAWWEVDELGEDQAPLEGSPAWVVKRIFTQIGQEERTMHWIAARLNELGFPAPGGGKWYASRVSYIVRHHCYTGNHAYNVHARVTNPALPMGDITAREKRTLLELKPEDQWVHYTVPALVSEDLWQRANKIVGTRGRGRGKLGKSIQALLRNRILCPQCERPMVVRRNGRQNRVYYHCSRYFRPWANEPCSYKRFIPATWDELVWEDLCSILRDDAWVDRQLVNEQSKSDDGAKLLSLVQSRNLRATARIRKVQEGYEGGVYTGEEAKRRIADLREAVLKAEEEIGRLQLRTASGSIEPTNAEAMKNELQRLRDRNLDEAGFQERLEVITRLGVTIRPAEDLESIKVECQLALGDARSSEATVDAGIIEPLKLGGDGE